MAKNTDIVDINTRMKVMSIGDKNAAAIITGQSAAEMFSYPDAVPSEQMASNNKAYSLVPWGAENNLPQQIIEKVSKSHDMSSNILFNTQLTYGSGIIPVTRTGSSTNNGELKIEYTPVLDNTEVNLFFENNDMSKWLSEQATDFNMFYKSTSSFLLNKDVPVNRKIVEMRHRDAAFCRQTKMNDKGKIEHCLYSPLWGDSHFRPADVVAIPALDTFNPMLDLKRRIGREIYPDASIKDEGVFEYVMHSDFASPGRTYYPKPPWWSLFESGWYDFAMAIPEFKKAILQNQMTLKYLIYFDSGYFTRIFQEEGIKTDPEKKARVEKEYSNIQKFLAGTKNAGKGAFGRISYSPDGNKEKKDVIITTIENAFKGGEYIEDSEEVSNIIAYGMGVHGSLIGSHGKSQSINGTEARELFIIKQAIQKPFRDRLLRPLYVVKAINKWPDNLEFIVANLQLTSLSTGTGSQKIIS